MKNKLISCCALLTFFFCGCEKEDIASIDDIIGTWESELAEVKVEKQGEEAWVTYIHAEYEATYGINPAITISGANCVIDKNYEFSYSSNEIHGEFKSPDKLVFKCEIDGHSVRYVLNK